MGRAEKVSTVSLTFGEMAMIPLVLTDIAEGTVIVGSSFIRRLYNRSRAYSIKEEIEEILDQVEELRHRDETALVSVISDIEIRKGTRKFLLNAVNAAIEHRTSVPPVDNYFEIYPEALHEEVNILKGLSLALRSS